MMLMSYLYFYCLGSPFFIVNSLLVLERKVLKIKIHSSVEKLFSLRILFVFLIFLERQLSTSSEIL